MAEPGAVPARSETSASRRADEDSIAELGVELRALLSGMLDAVVAIDSWGTIRMASDSVRRMFGWKAEELVGRNVSLLMPEPHRSRHDGYLARFRETGETWILNTTREFEVVHREGHPFWVELSVSRLDLPDRGLLFCGAFRDVTDRKRAQAELAASERRFHAIFDQEFQLVGLLDPSGVVVEINAAGLRILEAGREEVVGRLFWETSWLCESEEMRAATKDWFDRAAAGEFVRQEVRVLRPSGDVRVVDLSLKPVHDDGGKVKFVLPEGRDVTELVRAREREARMLKALAAIGESASLLAHEIKNPITSIHLALRAVSSQLGQDERAAVEELQVRLERLEAKLRRTLSFAKPLDLKLAPTDVLPLVLAPVDAHRPEAEQRSVEVELDVPPTCPRVTVDGGLVGDLIGNLIRNALDAVADGGRIRVRARGDREALRITVEDDGPGIPDKVRETLFLPFTTTKERGTGLGLPLARKIAEEHGGRLTAGDGELGGARFELVLPILATGPPLRPSA